MYATVLAWTLTLTLWIPKGCLYSTACHVWLLLVPIVLWVVLPYFFAICWVFCKVHIDALGKVHWLPLRCLCLTDLC
jgi:hypothetical protein